MMNHLAQINIGPPGGFRGEGPLGLENTLNATLKFDTLDTFNTVLQTTIGVMTLIAFIWFTIQFFLGAVGYITSGGDKSKVEQSRNKISSGLLGIVVVVSATFVISLVGELLGIKFLRGIWLLRDMNILTFP